MKVIKKRLTETGHKSVSTNESDFHFNTYARGYRGEPQTEPEQEGH